MALWLRKSTATTVVVGPLVDSVDASAETGLTISQSEILLWKQGGAGFSAKNDASAATHRSYGMYTVPLDATDTNTYGQLIVGVYEAGILVARSNFMVVDSNVYDTFFGTDTLHADVTRITGLTNPADNLGASAGAMVRGTTYSSGGTTTTFETESIVEATTDHYKGRIIMFTNGALDKQATLITGYTLTGGRGVFTFNALTEAVPNSSTFIIV